jgi:thiol-disulfide isomerase/thioredoxin
MKNISRIFLLIVSLLILSESAFAQEKLELSEGLNKAYQAPEISGINNWLNGKALKISDLKGKVVLIDFWTYSCINCIRTLPHMNELQEKYADKGLVIIGVHSPEFDFEKNPQNVEKAIKRFEIKYPVALDSDLKTWNNFKNKYWPAHYLIDQTGKVVYTHFGEGNYDVTEKNIATLLKLNQNNSSKTQEKVYLATDITPETYLGLKRRKNNFNQSQKKLTFPQSLPINGWGLEGEWKSANKFIESKKSQASLRLNFNAKKVFLVMASNKKTSIKVDVFFNGKKVDKSFFGADVKNGSVTVAESRLYELLNLNQSTNGVLEIKAEEEGLQAYAFTFES